MAFKLKVEGFVKEGNIPVQFTCDGKNAPPAVQWEGEPPETKSFALIVDDPDAPGGSWSHWLVWDIPVSKHTLEPGSEDGAVKCGTNDFGNRDYGGPCPPRGHGAHRYFFRVFALNTPALGLPEGARRPALEKALQKCAIAETSYMGRYQRH